MVGQKLNQLIITNGEMRSKIIKLYRTDFDEFIKLVKLLFPKDSENEGLQNVLWDRKNEEVSFFIINNKFINYAVLIEEIIEIAEKSQILKKFKLI